MSIDLDVIPGSPQPIRWGELKSLIQGTVLASDVEEIIGSVVDLFDVRSKRAIRESEQLGCPGYYYFEFGKRATLSLTLEPTTGRQDAVDYIGDFARNLLPEPKDAVRRAWELAGFLVTVTSYGGRERGELKLLVHLAACIAELTKGYVVVTDNGVFHLSVGVFAPKEFVPRRE